MTPFFSRSDSKKVSEIDFRIMRKEERNTFFEFLTKLGWVQIDQPFEFDQNWSHNKIRRAAKDNAAQMMADLLIETEDEAFSSSPFNNLVYYVWRRTQDSMSLPPGYTVPPLPLMQQLVMHREHLKRTQQFQQAPAPGQPPAQPGAAPAGAPNPLMTGQKPGQPPAQQPGRPPAQPGAAPQQRPAGAPAPGQQAPGRAPPQQPVQQQRPPQQQPQQQARPQTPPGQPPQAPPKPQAPAAPQQPAQQQPAQARPQTPPAQAAPQAPRPQAPAQAPPPCPKCKQPMAVLPNGTKQCRQCGTTA